MITVHCELKDNKLYIPIKSIGNGETKIITSYNYDNIKIGC